MIIVAAYAAVTIARAATVYPILAIFNKFGNKISTIWRNIAMLGGVRGALSIALVATITTSAVISQGDINMLNTMVLGVAFISIVLQVPTSGTLSYDANGNLSSWGTTNFWHDSQGQLTNNSS